MSIPVVQQSPGSVSIYPDAENASAAAAELFASLAADAIRERQVFRVALSGGSTPKRTYELLATPKFATHIDWQRVHVFWGDERYVPADDAESNYGMAAEALLRHVPIPKGNVHRFRTELQPPAEAARAYEDEIRGHFGTAPPRFDLIDLGLGPDGHTASLFPGSSALNESSRLVIADFVGKTNSWRLTMSVSLINAARVVAFLITGAQKASILHDILLGPRAPDRLPAQLISPQGELRWQVDEAAAALLPHSIGRK